jgi:uracil-DNA glycosylase
MKERKSAAELIPPGANLKELREAAANCQACDLWKDATRTVFGEGARGAKVMFVGEQPGNDEDLQGKPFVGPAGKLLDKVLQELGIDRNDTYVTNVVKHFKWVRRGKRRIHEKPRISEIIACRPWLEAEIAIVKPKVIVCLGATAAQAPRPRLSRDKESRGVCAVIVGTVGYGHSPPLVDSSRPRRGEPPR